MSYAPPVRPTLIPFQSQNLSSNQQRVPVAYLAGTRLIALHPITGALNEQKVQVTNGKKGGGGSKKGGSAQASYNYYGSLSWGISWGPIDGITALIENGNYLWKGNLALTADVTDLTGSLLDPTATIAGGYWKIRRGTTTQPVDPADGNICAYRNTALLTASGSYFGQDTGTAPNLQMIPWRIPRIDTSIVAAADNFLDDGQANIVAAVAELISDERGWGLPLTSFDGPSWQTAAHWCAQDADHRLATFMSPLVTGQSALREMLTRLMDPFNGFVRWNGAGKLSCCIYEWGTDPGGLPVLDANFWVGDPPKMGPMGDWTDVKTETVVAYTDRDYEFQENTVLIPNPVASDIRKIVDQGQLDRKDITRRNQAQIQGQEYDRRMSLAPATFSLKGRQTLVPNLQVGDKVKINSNPEPAGAETAQLCRVKKITRDRTDAVSLTLMVDPLAAATAYTPAWTPATPVSPVSPPILHAQPIPLPPAAFSMPPAVAILATRPGWNVIGMEVYFSPTSGGSYADLGEQPGFACRGTLAAAIAAGDTTIQITQTDGLSSPDANLAAATPGGNTTAAQDDVLLAVLMQLDGSGGVALDGTGNPIMEFASIVDRTFVSGSTFSYDVLRGRLGTSAAAWPNGAICWIVPSANLVEWRHGQLSTLFGQPAYFRLISMQNDATDESTPVPQCETNMAALTSSFIRSASSSSSGNLLYNSDFRSTDKWTTSNGTSGLTPTLALDTGHQLVGGGTLTSELVTAGATLGSYWDIVSSLPVPVIAGQTIEAYAYLATANAESEILLTWLDKTGAVLSTTSSSFVSGAFSDGKTLDQYQLAGLMAPAPSGASQVQFSVRNQVTGVSNPQAWAVHAYMGYAAPGQTTWTPWAPAGVQIVTSGSVDNTPPIAPTAPTFSAATISLSQSNVPFGTLSFWVSALPQGAVKQELVYRLHGAAEWLSGSPLVNTALTLVEIPDLTPGTAYDVGIRATSFSGVSTAVVLATGGGSPAGTNPYTVLNATPPADVTGLAAYGPSSSHPVPPQYLGGTSGVQMFGGVVVFTPSTSPDIDHYEYFISNSGTTNPGTGAAWTPIPKAQSQIFVYLATLLPAFCWVRAKNTSALYSAGVACSTNLNSVVSLAAGSMSTQNSNQVIVSGIQTGSAGASSVRQILAVYPFNTVVTLAGGLAEETINLSIANAGFTTKPDGTDGAPNVSSNPAYKARYDWDDAGNSSTNAVLKISRYDGTNTSAGSYRVTGKFFAFD